MPEPKILRWKRGSNLTCSLVDKKIENVTFDDSCVDKTKFRPNVNDVHNYTGGTNNIPLYDFEDGKDTGLRLGSLRSNGADITELKRSEALLKQNVENQKSILNQEVEKVLQTSKNKPTAPEVAETGSN